MGLVAQYQLSTFSSPVNGTTPVDANTVRGNDNTIKSSHNSHDADATIHLQNGAVASRPAAGTAGRTWLASDTGAVVGSYDTGSVWVSWNYVATDSTGAATITSTTSPQLTVKYDGSNYVTIGVSSAGAVTINAVGASAGFSFSDLVTAAAGLTVSSGQTLTVTGATITGLTAASVAAGSFPSGNYAFPALLSAAGSLAVASGQKFLLDSVAGTGDTYITEAAANVMAFFAGGTRMFNLDQSGNAVYVQSGRVFQLGEPAQVSASTPSTHKIPIRDNSGTQYYLLVTT